MTIESNYKWNSGNPDLLSDEFKMSIFTNDLFVKEGEKRKMEANLYQEIRKELGEMTIIDSHSHIAPEAAWKTMPIDFMSLLDYSSCDIVSAGLPRDEWVTGVAADSRMRFDYGYDYKSDLRTPAEKWNAIKKYWPFVKNIGSGYLVQKALQMYCGETDLNDSNIEKIGEILDQYRKDNSYEDILVKKAKIKTVMGVTMDINENPTTDIIKQQLYIDIYTGIQNRRQVYNLEQLSGQHIYNLKSYLHALDLLVEKQVKQGIVALKWHFFSYMRPFNFEIADPFEAEKALNKILQLPLRGATGSAVSVGFEEMKPLHNYLQHYMIEKAIEYHLPIQIHTGTFGGTLGSHIEYSNPTLLIDIFKKYQDVDFNILHSSFPYQREAAEIARMFPNVYVNAAWEDTLSPMAFKDNMKEWITYIPNNKIFAFGSDQFSAYLTYASAENTRDLLAEVFTELVEEKRMTQDEALWTAKRILCDNVSDYYKLD